MDVDANAKVIEVESRTGAQMVAEAQLLQAAANDVADKIIKLFGGNRQVSNHVQYNRSLALQKFEECMHRINDGMHFLIQTAVDAREAAAEKVLGGKNSLEVLQGGK